MRTSILLFLCSVASANAGDLLVENVSAEQRAATTLVDVFYDLEADDDAPVTIWLFLSADGGDSYPHLCSGVSGDVGANVEPGPARQIVWNVADDFPDLVGNGFRVRVVADDSPYGDTFAYCPPGTFGMGSPEDEPGRTSAEILHGVSLSHGFWIAKNAVTEVLWRDVLGGGTTSPDLPKTGIDWDLAVHFCNALSTQEGLDPAYTIHGPAGHVSWNREASGYRLPTEAEWEYACRAGTQTAFASGPITYPDGCSDLDPNLDLIGWYCANTDHAQPVGAKAPNLFGLHDMHGNVYNWIWDGFRADYEMLAGADPVHDVAPGAHRVIRGGSRHDPARQCRAAARSSAAPTSASDAIGLRLARTVFPPQVGVGTVEVVTAPAPLEASWRITGPLYVEGSGSAVLPGMPAGSYTATWDDVPGYGPPPSETGVLTADGNVMFNGDFVMNPQVPYPLAVKDIQPYTAVLNWAMLDMSDVFVSSENYVVKYDGAHFFLSEDHGQTYTRSFPCELSVQYVFIFADGSILFATHTACYYSHDWNSYSESTVWGTDGLPYVPQEFDNFTGQTVPPYRDLRNGREVVIWGNYTTRPGIQNDHVYLWYTPDRGVNVRACYKFNEPHTLNARHVHSVDCSPDGKWYIQTGDFADECHVIRAEYDDVAGAWTFTTVGSTGGDHYKWFQMVWEGDYVYYSWDTSPGGVMRFRYPEDIGSHENHEMVLATPNDCLMLFHNKPTGEMIATITTYGGSADSRDYYYSPNGADWHLIVGVVPPGYGPQSFYLNNGVINDLGVAATKMHSWHTPVYTWPTVTLDVAIRAQGFPDAFPYRVDPVHACHYDLEYRRVGGDASFIEGLGDGDLPLRLYGLLAGTEYEYRVRSVGAAGAVSEWTEWIRFSTRP